MTIADAEHDAAIADNVSALQTRYAISLSLPLPPSPSLSLPLPP
jgi:hypothetical protein